MRKEREEQPLSPLFLRHPSFFSFFVRVEMTPHFRARIYCYFASYPFLPHIYIEYDDTLKIVPLLLPKSPQSHCRFGPKLFGISASTQDRNLQGECAEMPTLFVSWRSSSSLFIPPCFLLAKFHLFGHPPLVFVSGSNLCSFGPLGALIPTVGMYLESAEIGQRWARDQAKSRERRV